MSRKIDLTQPLSDEDRQYLEDRARHRDIEIADANARGEDLDHATVLPDDSIQASTPQSPDSVPAAAGEQEVRQTPGSEDLASPVTERTVDATTPDDNYDEEDAWSHADLKAEVKDRKEDGADDAPALNSSRETLIEWLRKDDARS